MLSAEERREIEAELPHYPDKQAACIDAMKIVQRYRGWLSDESIREIAEFLGMSPDDLDSVATFYNLIYRKPVGRHVILLCNSVSCWIMGYDRLRERLCQRLGIQLGETTADRRFTLLPIVCLGTCDHAPALLLDNDLHRDLSPNSVEQILESYR
ncbi:MAG TPA: NADH-quinone oxidoreductase subunit NuoE [Terriglobales bacterium]|jgi:NADH-quinone oxidoreductase subunit E|nr:NADH-quinone oxidoreductase subunit NuoE [Terriglobales bacterium]